MPTNMVFHKHLASYILATEYIPMLFGMLRDTWNESLRCQFGTASPGDPKDYLPTKMWL